MRGGARNRPAREPRRPATTTTTTRPRSWEGDGDVALGGLGGGGLLGVNASDPFGLNSQEGKSRPGPVGVNPLTGWADPNQGPE